MRSSIALLLLVGAACSQPAADETADAGTRANPVTCEDPCDIGYRCVDGACVPTAKTMHLLVGRFLYDGDWTSLFALCTSKDHAGRYPPPSPPIDTDGPCRLSSLHLGSTSTPPSFVGDPGEVTVTGSTFGPQKLTRTFPDSECFRIDPPPLVRGEETVTLTTTGGADFPATTLQATTPPIPAMATGTLVRGQPLEVTWTPGPSHALVTVVTTDAQGENSMSIDCDVDGNAGKVTIPGSLTAGLLPGKASLEINLTNTTMDVHAPADTDMGVTTLTSELQAVPSAAP